MKLTKNQLNNLIKSVLLEDTHRIKSSFTTSQTDSSKKGSTSKAVYDSEDTNVDTGEIIKTVQKEGSFPNGVIYSSEDSKFTWADASKSSQKFLSIGRGGESVGVGYAVDKGKGKITLFKDGKIIKNPFVVFIHFLMLGINPIDIIKVIKEISTGIDTSELEAEADKIDDSELKTVMNKK